jgi:hypothetical protein
MSEEELKEISKEVNDLLLSKGCALRIDHSITIEPIKRDVEPINKGVVEVEKIETQNE